MQTAAEGGVEMKVLAVGQPPCPSVLDPQPLPF